MLLTTKYALNDGGQMTLDYMNHDPREEYPHLLHSLCYREAVKIVKGQLAARGDRVHKYSALDLRILAEAYLDADAHCELLMVETIMKVLGEPRLLRLAESESKRRARDRVKPMNPERALQKIRALELLGKA